jgi:hypothetical protein
MTADGRRCRLAIDSRAPIGGEAMRHSSLADTVTEFELGHRTDYRSGWRLTSAAGWMALAIVFATAAASIGLALAKQLPVIRLPASAFDVSVMETAALLAGIVAVYGLLAGGLAGLLTGRPRPAAAALRHGLGWAAIGAVAGGLGPVLNVIAGGRMSMAAATIIACGVAGVLAALVGYTRRQKGVAPISVADRTSKRTLLAAGWAAAAVAVAALACVVGVTAGRRVLQVPWSHVTFDGNLIEATGLMAGLGAAYGLLAGAAAGLMFGGRGRVVRALKQALLWAPVGALAGGLGPVLDAIGGGQLSPVVASSIACGVAGLLAALVAYALCREPPDPHRDMLDDLPAEGEVAERPPPAVGRVPDAGAVVQQWPILLVSAACLAIIVLGPASPAGWPLLAVAFLGFAAAWALAKQGRRLRELEDRLRERAASGRPQAASGTDGGESL